jgi:predicted amidophosphoribosyltransferase
MKTCPNCRMETRADADWCWHCGYSYEEAEDRPPSDQAQDGATDNSEETKAARKLKRAPEPHPLRLPYAPGPASW